MQIRGRWLHLTGAGVLVLGLVVPATAGMDAPRTLCRSNESAIFSCELPSEELVSVCASRSQDQPGRYLQYRYGQIGRVDFQFPARRVGSVEKFRARHYFRASVDRRELSFQHLGTRYTVFSYFEGEEAPAQRNAGIVMERDGAEEARTLVCRGAYLDRLAELDVLVPRDAATQ